MGRLSHADEALMKEALRLAKIGEGRTLSNPMVGALVVKRGRIISRGYHRAFGMPHAEIEALRRAGTRAQEATIYVNLEPCSHFGKTPPCADAIVKAGVRHVVCATRDPNRIARGGIEKLRRAGIKVSVGVCAKEARELNEAFFVFHEKRRPFVALKFAASLDGKLGTRTGDSKWITNKQARAYARCLRGAHQAVLVGIETVLVDDPLLTARTRGMSEPTRIILDSRLRIPLNAHVLKQHHYSSVLQNTRIADVIVATTRNASARKKRELERGGARILSYRGNRVPIKRLLASLWEMNIVSVLVEGGGSVLGSFLDAGIVDKVYAFYAPMLIGGKEAVAIEGRGSRSIKGALHLNKTSITCFGNDALVIASR